MFHKSPHCGQPTRNRRVKLCILLVTFPAFLRILCHPCKNCENFRRRRKKCGVSETTWHIPDLHRYGTNRSIDVGGFVSERAAQRLAHTGELGELTGICRQW